VSRDERSPVCWADKARGGRDAGEAGSEIRAEVRSHQFGFCVWDCLCVLFFFPNCLSVQLHVVMRSQCMMCPFRCVRLPQWRGLKEVPFLGVPPAGAVLGSPQ